jgi:phenylpropionate dioxygenase-like ring-hydroxylating dioxygenase large terminal subunit
MKAVASFEYAYDGNWKLLYENTLDDYHAEHLHSHVYLNVPGFNYGGDYMRQARSKQEEPSTRSCSQLGMHSILEWHDPREKMPFQKERTHRLNLAVFPTFLGVYHPVLDITGLRIIKPDAAGHTRVLTYCLAPKDLDEAASQAVAERFSAAWGPGGRIMMDDLRCLALVQKGLKARAGGDVIISRGIERAGATGTVADEHSIRAFWKAWRGYMAGAGEGARIG